MSLKSLHILPALAAFAVLVGACSHSGQPTDADRARELYRHNLALLRSYTDSLSVARDSDRVLSLFSRFDDAVTKLNYNYPPDTDRLISEGENDTLARMTLRLVSLRDSLLYRFAHPVVPTDSSLSVDSISQALGND